MNETVKQKFYEGYSDIKKSGLLDGTVVDWKGINPNDYIGKTVYVAVTEKTGTGAWTVKAVTSVTITGNNNQDYVKTSFTKPLVGEQL